MTPTTAFPLPDPALAELLTSRLAVVEERLRDAVAHADVLADATARHLVNAGGKRLRPLLTLLAAQLGDGQRPEVLDAAVVVELTHLATLYHDDVMDSAPLRRGAPAAHEVWGNSVAILTGDLLFARASSVVAGLGPEAVRMQAATFERLCLGQLHETVGPQDGEDAVDALPARAVGQDRLAHRHLGPVRRDVRRLPAGGAADRHRVRREGRRRLPARRRRHRPQPGRRPHRQDARHRPARAGADHAGAAAARPGRGRRARPTPTARCSPSSTATCPPTPRSPRRSPRCARTRCVAETRALAVAWAEDAVAELRGLPSGPATDALTAFADALVDRAS